MRKELTAIDPSRSKGLEIGPLANPRVQKSEGAVSYLDHATTEQLRLKYQENSSLRPFVNDIVEVDYVVEGTQSISAVVGKEAPFDYVIAAHVIEHIPNLVGWLQDIAKVLRPGGILSLVIPDKRFTFDVNRTTTEVSELVDAYLRHLRNPSVKQMYDFFSRVVTIDGSVDTAAIWAGTADYSTTFRTDVPDPHVAAYRTCVEQVHLGHFVDVHCHLFTPSSFLDVCEALGRLDLMPFEIVHFSPTEINGLEFFVSMKKLPDFPDQEARDRHRRAEQTNLQRLREAPSDSSDWDLAHASCSSKAPLRTDSDTIRGSGASPTTMEVSTRERQLIDLKRRVLVSLRHYARGRRANS
jgi:SAM-dependent methyltransferase